MIAHLKTFEKIVRAVPRSRTFLQNSSAPIHPFDERNIHPEVSRVSIKLFNDGHYSQATFEAFKLIEKTVKKITGSKNSGHKLMMEAFDASKPNIKLNDLSDDNMKDEQEGYRFIFSGATTGIRNPRAHDINFDSVDKCLDHLSIASVLFRKIESRLAP